MTIQNNRVDYLRHLDNMDKEDGLEAYLKFALKVHYYAIKNAIDRCDTSYKLNEFFRDRSDISEEQQHIIRTMMSFPGKKWCEDEILFDMDDDELAVNAWNDLVDKQYISGGVFYFDALCHFYENK